MVPEQLGAFITDRRYFGLGLMLSYHKVRAVDASSNPVVPTKTM